MVYIAFDFFAWAHFYYILSSALDGQNDVANQLNFMVDIAEKKEDMVNMLAKLSVLFFPEENINYQRKDMFRFGNILVY